MPPQRRLALLIDGDNAQAVLLPNILDEVNKYGIAIIRRVYGDWTKPQMAGWQAVTNDYALQPIQQFRYTTGKNATDSALIIDAMDILHTAEIDGFCLVSSDSDYTRLATRIQEKNLFVLGIGKKLTPQAFVNACNTFVYTEDLQPAEPAPTKPPVTNPAPNNVQPIGDTQTLKALFVKAFALNGNGSSLVQLSAIGSYLRQIDPAFEPQTYGYERLSQLVEAHPNIIEVKKNDSIYYVRMKQPKTKPLKKLLAAAFDLAVKENGWANLGELGNRLRQIDPAFEPQTYGHKQLLQLVQAHPQVQVKKNGTVHYVRIK